MGYVSYFQKDLDMITRVTQALNQMGEGTSTEGFYIHVELRSQDDHTVFGEWSDEISSDGWYYQPRDGSVG